MASYFDDDYDDYDDNDYDRRAVIKSEEADEIGLVGLQIISQLKDIEDSFDDFNKTLKKRLKEEQDMFEEYPVSSMSRGWIDKGDGHSDRSSITTMSASSEIVESLRASTFKVRLSNAFSDIIRPMAASIELIEIENRAHNELLQERVSSQLERVVHEIRTSRTNNTTLTMKTASFFRELYAHPGLTALTTLNNGLRVTLKPLLFGFGKRESDADRTIKAINQQTEYLRTGAIDKRAGLLRAIGRGLIPHMVQGVAALYGIRRGVAQEREDAMSRGEEVKGVASWLSHFFYKGSIIQRDRPGGLLNKTSGGNIGGQGNSANVGATEDDVLVKEAKNILSEIHSLLLSSRTIEGILRGEFASIIDLSKREYEEVKVSNKKDLLKSEQTLYALNRMEEKSDNQNNVTARRNDQERKFEKDSLKLNEKSLKEGSRIVKYTKTTADETKKARFHQFISTIITSGIGVANALVGAVNAVSSVIRTSIYSVGALFTTGFSLYGGYKWLKGKVGKPQPTGPQKPGTPPPGGAPKSTWQKIKGVGGVAGRLVTPAFAALTGYEAYQNVQNDDERILSDTERKYRGIGAGIGATGGFLGGALAGGKAGAGLGTLIGGPFGTVIGGIAGAIGGGYLGYQASKAGATVGDFVGGMAYRSGHVSDTKQKGVIASQDLEGVVVDASTLKAQADLLGLSFREAAKELEKAGGHVMHSNGEIVRYTTDWAKLATGIAVGGAELAKDAMHKGIDIAKDASLKGADTIKSVGDVGWGEMGRDVTNKASSGISYAYGKGKDAYQWATTREKKELVAIRPTDNKNFGMPDHAEMTQRQHYSMFSSSLALMAGNLAKKMLFGGTKEYEPGPNGLIFGNNETFGDDFVTGAQQGFFGRASTEIMKRFFPQIGKNPKMNITGGLQSAAAEGIGKTSWANKLIAGIDRLNIIQTGMSATAAYRKAGQQEGLSEEEIKARKIGAGLGAGVTVAGTSLLGAGAGDVAVRKFNAGPPWFRVMVPLIAGAITGGISASFKDKGAEIGETLAAKSVTPKLRMPDVPPPIEVRGQVENDETLVLMSKDMNEAINGQNRLLIAQHEEIVAKNDDMIKVLKNIETNTRGGKPDAFTDSPYRATIDKFISNSIRGR